LQGQGDWVVLRQNHTFTREERPGERPVKRETLRLGALVAVCVALLTAALVMRTRARGAPPVVAGGTAPPDAGGGGGAVGAPEAGASPAAGAAAPAPPATPA